MKSIYYPAIFHPEETGYSVIVPDIEGCCTQGDTLEEAIEMTQDAIGLLLEDADSFPVPSAPHTLDIEENDRIVYIPFSMIDYKRKNDTRSVKKTLSLPYWLNEAAESAHLNFSGVLQEALKSKLGLR